MTCQWSCSLTFFSATQPRPPPPTGIVEELREPRRIRLSIQGPSEAVDNFEVTFRPTLPNKDEPERVKQLLFSLFFCYARLRFKINPFVLRRNVQKLTAVQPFRTDRVANALMFGTHKLAFQIFIFWVSADKKTCFTRKAIQAITFSIANNVFSQSVRNNWFWHTVEVERLKRSYCFYRRSSLQTIITTQGERTVTLPLQPDTQYTVVVKSVRDGVRSNGLEAVVRTPQVCLSLCSAKSYFTHAHTLLLCFKKSVVVFFHCCIFPSVIRVQE